MRSYVLKKVTSAPDWDTIDALPIDNLQWTNPPVDIRAQGQLCWDEAAIYVRLRAWETEIRAEHSGLLQSVCEDSCLEFLSAGFSRTLHRARGLPCTATAISAAI